MPSLLLGSEWLMLGIWKDWSMNQRGQSIWHQPTIFNLCTFSPIRDVRFGATAFILLFKYSWMFVLKVNRFMTLEHKSFRVDRSISEMSWPMEILAASTIWVANSPSVVISSIAANASSLALFFSPMKSTNLAKMQLSVTILANSGKCQEYHSLILIHSVFKSLSNLFRIYRILFNNGNGLANMLVLSVDIQLHLVPRHWMGQT